MSLREDYAGFRLRLTRWGALFLLMVLLAGFAAVNTGNNGLMLVVAVALGSYIVSGIWSRQILGKIRIRVRKPREIFAGRTVDFPFEAENFSGIFPACGLLIRNLEGIAVGGIESLPPRGREESSLRDVFGHRGPRRAGPWRVEVLLPLGFFLKSKEIPGPGEILVYPEILPGALRRREAEGMSRGVTRWTGRGREGEVFQLRDFDEADDARQIHWKQSARQDRLIAVDRRRPRNRPLVLRLDPLAVDPEDEAACRRFEGQISACTAEILRKLNMGEAIALQLGDRMLGPVAERASAYILLEALAGLQAGVSGWDGAFDAE